MIVDYGGGGGGSSGFDIASGCCNKSIETAHASAFGYDQILLILGIIGRNLVVVGGSIALARVLAESCTHGNYSQYIQKILDFHCCVVLYSHCCSR